MNLDAASPWRLRTYKDLASTQSAAINAAEAGDPGRLAIMAEIQTSGRGTRGRAWSSPHGNLHLSVMLRSPGDRVDPGCWSLLAAVVLHDTLSQHAANLVLKWPNDVLLDGRKVAGILIDRSPGWVVIGIGANLMEAPTLPNGQTARIPPPAPCPGDVAWTFLRGLDAWFTRDLRAAWLARAHPLGTSLKIVTPRRQIEGRFAGLAANGALLLEGESEPISSGEVFLSRPVTMATGCNGDFSSDHVPCYSL